MIQAFVTGNLGKDAETRQAGSETVTSFNVASNRKAKGNDVVTWIGCSLWGKRGEALKQYLTKGTKVAVSGELSTREYQGKTYVEVRVAEIDLMGGGNKGGGKRDSAPQGDTDDSGPPAGGDEGEFGDIPF